MVLEYFLVFVLTILAGGWSIPAGILFGLNPLGVYVAAALGSITFTLVFIALGGRCATRSSPASFPEPRRGWLRAKPAGSSTSTGWRALR